MPQQQYPSQLFERAVSELAKLPSIGHKTALRLALHLMRQEAETVQTLTNALLRLRQETCFCQQCHNIADAPLCQLCADNKRDHSLLCVVEDTRDVMAIEATKQYNGLYHVLGGVISPMDGIAPQNLNIPSLIERAQQPNVKEVILALAPTMQGDTTNYFLARRLATCQVHISEIARGVAQNDQLQYADEITLGRSILHRTPYTARL